jgi:hypothetical protein
VALNAQQTKAGAPRFGERGRRGGRKTKTALARLHSGGSLNRSHAFAAEGGGSFAAPSGARSLEGKGSP